MGELLRPDFITKSFGCILRENSDVIKKIKFHSLRHSVGSMLAQNNVNQAQIQAYLGHKNIRSSSIYMHVNYNSQNNGILYNICYADGMDEGIFPIHWEFKGLRLENGMEKRSQESRAGTIP